MKTPILALCAAAALLAGCASAPAPRAMLTYQTVPEGAQLFEAGQPIGTEPVTRTYAAQGGAGTITTPDVVAVWPSGARTSFFTILKVGDDRVATLQRPAGAPGQQADLDHAKKVLASRQTEAERIKREQLRDTARASARCKAQQSGTGNSASATDDCN
jgi:hypothetical protein